MSKRNLDPTQAARGTAQDKVTAEVRPGAGSLPHGVSRRRGDGCTQAEPHPDDTPKAEDFDEAPSSATV